jgi:hypothetical protein
LKTDIRQRGADDEVMWKFVGRSSQERDEILFFFVSFPQKELNKDVESNNV